MSTPEKLQEIWTEEELIKKFGLTQGKTGRSTQIGNWIAKGMPYILLSGRRLFFENDVVGFLDRFRKERKFEES